MILTSSEIVTNVSTRGFDSALIKDADILATELRYFSEIVGEDLYNNIVANPSDYTSLLAILKPALSYYALYMAFWDINGEVNDRGIFALNQQNGTTPDTEKLKTIRESYTNKANGLMQVALKLIITEYDANNTDYTTYLTEILIFNIYDNLDSLNSVVFTSNTKMINRL